MIVDRVLQCHSMISGLSLSARTFTSAVKLRDEEAPALWVVADGNTIFLHRKLPASVSVTFLISRRFLAIQIQTKDQSQLRSPTRFCTTSLQVVAFRSRYMAVTLGHLPSQIEWTFVKESWVVFLNREFLH